MLRRDFLQAQMQKLAQVLARIIGLKRDGLPEEADALLQQVLKEEFGLEPGELGDLTPEQFTGRIREQGYGPEKADLLSQFLYQYAIPFSDENDRTRNILGKLLALYDLLETDFHRQSLDNLNRRKQIMDYLASSGLK